VVGRPCHAAIAASLGGTRLCSASCAEHVTSGDDRKDVRGAVVKGHLTRLVCAPLGDGATIALVSAQDPIEDTTPLSPREREVLGLVAQGLTGKEIAARLKLSVSTVRTHVEHAREKLGAHSRAEAVQKATARGEL
jgi:two-component system nitrate/nitrite response regulator NarL